MTVNNNQNPQCLDCTALLSDYLDSMLPARQMWEVEKHLAGCSDCAAEMRTLKAMLELMHSAERYDTGNDFMANLHARLDHLEPEPANARFRINHLKDWLADMREAVWSRRAPALGLGMAVIALTVLVTFNRPQMVENVVGAPMAASVSLTSEPLHRNVALTAGNPFEDPLAANLEAHSALKDGAALPVNTGE